MNSKEKVGNIVFKENTMICSSDFLLEFAIFN